MWFLWRFQRCIVLAAAGPRTHWAPSIKHSLPDATSSLRFTKRGLPPAAAGGRGSSSSHHRRTASSSSAGWRPWSLHLPSSLEGLAVQFTLQEPGGGGGGQHDPTPPRVKPEPAEEFLSCCSAALCRAQLHLSAANHWGWWMVFILPWWSAASPPPPPPPTHPTLRLMMIGIKRTHQAGRVIKLSQHNLH